MLRIDVGSRHFIDSSWDPVADPLVLALGITYEPDDWLVGVDFGTSYSTDDGNKDGSGYRSTNWEFYGGISKSFWPVKEKLIWTFGTGLTLNFPKERINLFIPPATNQGVEGNDRWVGAYLRTRLGWMFSETLDLGIELRGTVGQDVATFGPVKSSDNYQVLIGLGIHL